MVVDFIRDKMGPVAIDTILKEFSESGIDESNLKPQVERALRQALKSGKLQRCNDFYFSASLDDDLKDWVDLSALDSMPADDDSDAISFSSCESSDNNRTEDSTEQILLYSHEESKTSDMDRSTE